MLGPLGAPELLIILAILALIFGASRFTALGRSLGQGIREFRSEVRRPDQEEQKQDATTSASTTSSDSEANRSS